MEYLASLLVSCVHNVRANARSKIISANACQLSLLCVFGLDVMIEQALEVHAWLRCLPDRYSLNERNDKCIERAEGTHLSAILDE